MTPLAPTLPTPAVDATPVQGFSQCHAGILSRLEAFRALPALQDAAQRARTLAQQTLDVFDNGITEHHSEEEDQLFDAVLRDASPGAERAQVKLMVDRLTAEHREIEGLWKRLRPQVQQAAAGKPGALRPEAVSLLVETYQSHARFEEREFLPLAAEILGRDGNHMAALGVALHMRHAQVPASYI